MRDFIITKETCRCCAFGQAMASAFAPAQSFEGGGHTGYAPRSGGLDGRGGFLAMVHPRERIIDEARGGSGGVRAGAELGTALDQLFMSPQGNCPRQRKKPARFLEGLVNVDVALMCFGRAETRLIRSCSM